MYAPHPPTRITDLLNPVRPPDRVLPSPSSSSASFSEEGRERVHIDRSNHQLDSPRVQSNTVHNNFIKQHSSNPPSPVSERQRHFNNYDRDNSPASCKPHIHSPTTPHAHALPQQTHQRAYSLRAASWDTATTNGGEVDPRSGRGRPNDDGDDRQSSSSPAVSTSWQRTQPSVRLPSIDHEGTFAALFLQGTLHHASFAVFPLSSPPFLVYPLGNGFSFHSFPFDSTLPDLIRHRQRVWMIRS